MIGAIGCTPTGTTNIITDVSFTGRSQRPNADCDSQDASGRRNCTPELLESLRFAKVGADDIGIAVKGTGRCNGFHVDFGDGTSTGGRTTMQLSATEQPIGFQHRYVNWPGKKQVRVTGIDCLGDFTKELSVGLEDDGHEDFRLGFVPNTNVCNVVSYKGGNSPILRPGAVVRITATGRIIYGVMEHDAGGDRTIAAPAGYPFPRHRPYSLVYRVRPMNGAPGDPLEVQGEDGPVIFTNTNRGVLEVCVNDHPQHLNDNITRTGMALMIMVNEARATGE